MAKLDDTATQARSTGDSAAAAAVSDGHQARMPLVGHLRELRSRPIKAMLGMAAGMVVGFVCFDRVWGFSVGPYCRTTIGGKHACNGMFGRTLIVGRGSIWCVSGHVTASRPLTR